jgi:Ca-activated chloride channel family protein
MDLFENKMNYAKEAVIYIAKNLTKKDKFSLICYNDTVSVPIRAQKIENLDYIKWAIERIFPSNSTNLSAGIIEGYNQASKYYQTNQVNRILLLSDGLANRGITNSDELGNIWIFIYAKR